MRTKITGAFLLFSLLYPGAAMAGWAIQSQGMGQTLGFVDVAAVNPSFAVAVGVIKDGSQQKSVAMITRDGVSWQRVYPIMPTGPLDLHIYSSVWFMNETEGIIGGIGEILTTQDGGGSWDRIDRGGMFGSAVNDLHGAGSAGGVFAVTSKGEVLHSADGGATWSDTPQPLGEVHLSHIFFIDDQYGWITAGQTVMETVPGEHNDEEKLVGYKDGALLQTTDGGATWEVLFSGEERAVNSISFVDDQFGWITSNSMAGPKVQHSADGGESWADLPLPQTTQVGDLNYLTSVHFFNRCEGWLMGGAGSGDAVAVLWHTVDGGKTWDELADRAFLKIGEMFGFPIEVNAISWGFVDRNIGWMMGSYESIFRYDADSPAPTCNAQNPDLNGTGTGDNGEDSESSAGGCSIRPGGPSGWTTIIFLLWLMLRRRRCVGLHF